MSTSRASLIQSVPDQPDQPESGPGLLSQIAFYTDHLLRSRESVYGDIACLRSLPRLCAVSLVMTAVFGGVYGVTVGLSAGGWQALVAAVKVPLLLASSLFAVAPALYAFNTLLGSRIRPVQLAALACATLGSTSVLLLALAPFSLFLSCAGLSYSLLKLAQVALFFVAGYCGAFFLYEGVQTVAARLGRDQSLPLLQIWLLAYGYVGAQLAWMLRPFVGDPARPFSVLRPPEGSFFSGVLDALMTAFRHG